MTSLYFLGGLVFGILLLIIPVVLNNVLKLGILNKLQKGSASLLILILIYGILLSFAIWQNHLWLTMLTALLIVGLTCSMYLMRLRFKLKVLLIQDNKGML